VRLSATALPSALTRPLSQRGGDLEQAHLNFDHHPRSPRRVARRPTGRPSQRALPLRNALAERPSSSTRIHSGKRGVYALDASGQRDGAQGISRLCGHLRWTLTRSAER
jgi:hypothetical protein